MLSENSIVRVFQVFSALCEHINNALVVQCTMHIHRHSKFDIMKIVDNISKLNFLGAK